MMLELDDDGVFSKVNEEDLIYVDKKELDEFVEEYNHLKKENEELKQRINSRLHYYRELYDHFDKNDGFSYNIVEKVVEDLEDILR